MSLCECGLTPHSVKGLAEALTTNKHLEELDISGNALDGDGINCLARMLSVNQCLKKLCVRKCSITVLSKSFTKALANNKHFEELNISDNALGDDIYFLAHALENNQRLKKLVLTTCSLNSISANNLAEALATNTHLEELYINDNPLLNDGIEHLAHALSVNQGLKKLYLRKCSITFLSESFAKALATNMNLEELDISENALGDDILHLVHGIRVNQGLKILHLNTCSFTSMSVKHLAEALTINKHLEALDISGNELCDNSIEHLAHALGINHNVKKLSLNDCRLTSWSAKSFAELLTTNKYLEELDVSNNALDGDSIRCLIHALQVNQKLKSLKMYDYPMTESGLECLAKCLQNNHNLTELVVPCTSSSSSLVNIEKAINDVRMKNGLPIISIKDHNNNIMF